MPRVLILGANGQLARNTTRLFLARTDCQLTLYLRRARRLSNPDPGRVTIVEGAGYNASTAATAVGYESTSQFGREFKRFFGATPAAEAATLRSRLA